MICKKIGFGLPYLNVGGGEAADQFVRMALSGTEIMLRLGGSALKNLLALTIALTKAGKKVYGKISLANMLKQTRDIRVFPMTKAQYKAFKKLAKKYGILFSAIADKHGKDKTFDLILPPSELDRANQIFERILYNPELGRESPEPPRDERRHWWQRAADRVRNIFRRRERPETETPERSPEAAPEPPVTVERVTVERVTENPTFPEPAIVYALPEQVSGTPEITQMPPDFTVPSPRTEPPRQEVIETTATVLPTEPESTPPTAVPVPVGTAERASPETPPQERAAEPPQKSQGDATPSRPGSPATSGKSTPENTTTNPEKPSVLQRLNFYREQSAKRDAPAKEKARGADRGAANPVKGKGRSVDGPLPTPNAPAKGVKMPKVKAPVR